MYKILMKILIILIYLKILEENAKVPIIKEIK